MRCNLTSQWHDSERCRCYQCDGLREKIQTAVHASPFMIRVLASGHHVVSSSSRSAFVNSHSCDAEPVRARDATYPAPICSRTPRHRQPQTQPSGPWNRGSLTGMTFEVSRMTSRRIGSSGIREQTTPAGLGEVYYLLGLDILSSSILLDRYTTQATERRYIFEMSEEIPKKGKAGVVVNEGPEFRVEIQDVDVPEPSN